MVAQMGNIDFEKIWKMMDEFDFQTTHKIPAEYLCTLCRKLMSDARICQCGCRFCNKCITQYLSDGDSFCPGKSNDCKEESLIPDVNIWIDHIMHKRIVNVRVSCPVEMCSHSDCLVDIEEHVRCCASEGVRCPYSHIGCDNIMLEDDNINTHLKSQKDKHIQIMMTKIENIQSENANLTNQIGNLQMENANLQSQIESLNESSNAMQARMEEEKRQLEHAKEAEIDQLKKQIDKYKSNLKVYFNKNPKEFKWTIPNLTQIKADKTILYSEEFYTHFDGYKLQLEMQHDGGVYRVYLTMVGDDYNGILLWPVTFDVKAGIVSSTTDSFAKSDRKFINFNSPGEEINCFSFAQSNLPNSSQSDSLSIKCVVRVLMQEMNAHCARRKVNHSLEKDDTEDYSPFHFQSPDEDHIPFYFQQSYADYIDWDDYDYHHHSYDSDDDCYARDYYDSDY